MQRRETIEYVEGLGIRPVMVLKNDTQIVILVNKKLPKSVQDYYIALVRDCFSEYFH